MSMCAPELSPSVPPRWAGARQSYDTKAAPECHPGFAKRRPGPMHTGERDLARRGRIPPLSAVFMGPGLFAARKTRMTVVGAPHAARHMQSPCRRGGRAQADMGEV